MLFTLGLGSMVGAAAVLLIGQWARDVFGGGERPIRLLTPSREYILRGTVRGRRAA